MTRRRPARARLLLVSLALATLVAGYYLGQYWQRRPLADLSAVVYPDGSPVALPLSAAGDGGERWRLVLTADLQQAACLDLLRHLALVRNRLAAWPRVQERLRLAVLDYTPGGPDGVSLPVARDWVELLRLERVERDALAGSLGIMPDPAQPCAPMQANSILVAPDLRRWALIPYEPPAIMARNIATIIQFVE